MTEKEFIDYVTREYANILADVVIGKNLNIHHQTVIECILEINLKVQQARAENLKSEGMRCVGYEFYLLKDQIECAHEFRISKGNA